MYGALCIGMNGTQQTEGNMMICKKDNTLHIGTDLVDCMTGKAKSHGVLVVDRAYSMNWLSTLPIRESETVIRKAATSEGRHISYFMSQAI